MSTNKIEEIRRLMLKHGYKEAAKELTSRTVGDVDAVLEHWQSKT